MPSTFEIPSYIFIYIILPFVVGLISFAIKNVLNRIAILEEKIQMTTTETEVRQLISDKYEPLLQDIKEIKESQFKQSEKLDKLVEMILKSDNKPN